MNDKRGTLLLVGDNPFHNISHLSQERARARGSLVTNPEYAASLVLTSMQNGANGFMFSVSETTLSIIKKVYESREEQIELYAIIPYAFEYVRLAARVGTPGLIKKISKEILFSGNLKAAASGLKGLMKADLIAIVKAYLSYEISRIKSSAGGRADLKSLLLHEVVTDMALAFNMDWFFKSYMDFISQLGMQPGFNTRNFAFLVSKFREWKIDTDNIIVATPFNKLGFQMNPSREDCEKALADLQAPIVIAISILASGYLKPIEAIEYIRNLPNIRGVAVGVSKEKHAKETFRLLSKELKLQD